MAGFFRSPNFHRPGEPTQLGFHRALAGHDQPMAEPAARFDREIAALVRRHGAREQQVVARPRRRVEAVELGGLERIRSDNVPAPMMRMA